MPSYSILSFIISTLWHYATTIYAVLHALCQIFQYCHKLLQVVLYKLACLDSYILSNFPAFISEQVSEMLLFIYCCFMFCLHYFCVDVKWRISSVYIFGAFMSHLVIELYSLLFSSGWICCRIFWIILDLAASKSIFIPG